MNAPAAPTAGPTEIGQWPTRDVLWGQAVSLTRTTAVHAHVMHELVVGFGPDGAQIIDGQPHDFHVGQLYFLPEGLPHNVYGTPDAPARFGYICFERNHFALTGRPVVQAVVDGWAAERQLVPPLPFELRLELQELGHRLIQELEDVHALGQSMADALLTEIVVKAHRQLAGPRRTVESQAGTALDAVCEAIAADPAAPVVLADTARQAGMSRTAFSVAFKRHAGMSLLEYVLAIRIQHASRLLESTDHSVAAIAGLSGFANLGHFHSAFRRRRGMTPRQYRLLSEAQGARA